MVLSAFTVMTPGEGSLGVLIEKYYLKSGLTDLVNTKVPSLRYHLFIVLFVDMLVHVVVKMLRCVLLCVVLLEVYRIDINE